MIRDFTGLAKCLIAGRRSRHRSAGDSRAHPDKDLRLSELRHQGRAWCGIGQAVITKKSMLYHFTNEGGIDGTTRLLKNICGLCYLKRCREEFKNAPKDVAELSALYNTFGNVTA